MEKKLGYATRQIHGGRHDLHISHAGGPCHTGSRGMAIYPTAAYVFDDCAQAAGRFELTEGGNIYTRLQNPTTSVYEERVASLYGAAGALATSAGHAATHLTITSLAVKGDNIVASPYVYGGTFNLLHNTMPKFGIETRMPNELTPEAFEELIDENTAFLFIESMSNPTCVVPDIEGIARVAHKHGIPLVVDNTFGACGYLCNPIEWGADIVIEAATKWINGHGTTMGGLIVEAGTFDWTGYKTIDCPSTGYHGLNFHKVFGKTAFVTKCRVEGLRDFAPCPSPFDSYLMCMGLETLNLRMDRIIDTTKKLADWLRNDPRVKHVAYTGLDDDPSRANTLKYFKYGAGPVINVELQGDLESTVRFVEALKLAVNMVMIGDSVTVVTHPASTTHKQMTVAEQAAVGVTPTLLRVSPGLEDVADIIADFDQAFDQANS